VPVFRVSRPGKRKVMAPVTEHSNSATIEVPSPPFPETPGTPDQPPVIPDPGPDPVPQTDPRGPETPESPERPEPAIPPGG
jgi:pilus assembly protein FimV